MPQFQAHLILVTSSLLAAVPALAADSAPAITNAGLMQARVGSRTVVVPLQRTEVRANIAAVVASVTVKQHFFNSEDTPIEAVYLFPLPQNAAVHGMTIRIGKRTIRATIKRRAEAKRVYQRAKREGRRAGLVEQHRPNIFSQRIANILPGERIIVTLRFVQRLIPVEGTYSFIFPLVVGPRYLGSHGPPKAKHTLGKASRTPSKTALTPLLLKKGLRPGHDVSIDLRIAGGPRQLGSPSHRIRSRQIGSVSHVSLHTLDTIPNRDFVLRYRLARKQPRVLTLSRWSKGRGHLMVLLQPPAMLAAAQLPPRELVFVVDNSGSMWGKPLARARALMQRIFSALRPEDRFQIIRFAGAPDRFRPTSVAATPANLSDARSYVEQMRGGGGTEFLAALEMALRAPKPRGRARIVLFITDGFIGYERKVLRYIRAHGKGSTVFALGVGSAVNRWLIDAMARIGGGSAFVLLDKEDPTAMGKRVYQTISRPALTDLQVRWGGLPLGQVAPRRISDLYLDKPIALLARYGRAASGSITISGRRGNKRFAIKVPVTLSTKNRHRGAQASQAVPLLWARERINDAMDTYTLDPDRRAASKRRVTQLALRYGLMSAFTAFVAVDDRVANRDQKSATRPVGVPLPRDVSERAAPPSYFGSWGRGSAGLGSRGANSFYPASAAGIGYGRVARKRRAPLAMLRAARATVHGSSARSQIHRVITRKLRVLRRCYEREASRDRTLKGRVVVAFAIDARGRTLGVRIHSGSLENKAVLACILRIFRGLRFAKPQGGLVKVTYPIHFRMR